MECADHYDLLSRLYDVLDWPFERFRYPRIRRRLCSDLSGAVLDAGVGTGKNLPYFPPEARVTGIDVSRGMLTRARRRARTVACEVDLRIMDATRLDFPDDTFDACVSAYMFCVMPVELQEPALRELLRVTKPGGQVRILEHRYSQRRWRRTIMKMYTPYVKTFFHSRYDHPIGELVRASGVPVLEEAFVTSDVEKLYVLAAGRGESRT